METPRKPGTTTHLLLGALVLAGIAALVLTMMTPLVVTMRTPRVKAYNLAADILARVGRANAANELRGRACRLQRGVVIVHYKNTKYRGAFKEAFHEFYCREMSADPHLLLFIVDGRDPDSLGIYASEELEVKLRDYLLDRGFVAD